ncbi:MAG TPA: thiamine phosphate synthase [Candidatus Dormibacteraeota bacterium]|nr:thiamine phosphate synthase [Candidatus Dormibacteraeota bacterium]
MRLRHGAQSVSGQASRNPQLGPLQAARLYVVTPDAAPERVVEIASAAARGGADVVQLRHKTMPRGELLQLARRLRALLSDVLFVVNDYVDIALLSDADGVHLGPDDLSVAAAREVAGDRLLIGASASSAERAREAVAAGADYLGSGPAFATPIKAEKQVLGPEDIAAIAKVVDVPVFAIGGIDATNIGKVIAAGVRRVCVIRAVGDAPDPEQATRNLRAMLSAE